MSKIIRQAVSAPTVYIGDKHLDFEKENIAEKRLSYLFPIVSVITDPDGAKLIPIQEINKIERILNEKLHITHNEGYQEGHNAGLKQGLDKAKNIIEQFDKAIRDAIKQREILFEEARTKILDLIIMISKKVTFDAIEVDPEVTLSMINGVIDTLIDSSKLVIKVHPNHLPIVEHNIDKFLKSSSIIKEISIKGDSRVQYGGCFIETPSGDIDARLESQFDVIKNELMTNEVEM